MKTIICKSERFTSGYEELLGHGCTDEAEMQRYCDALDPTRFSVVDAPFDPGEFIPEDQRPKKDPFPTLTAKYDSLNDEEKARFMEGLKKVMAALKA